MLINHLFSTTKNYSSNLLSLIRFCYNPTLGFFLSEYHRKGPDTQLNKLVLGKKITKKLKDEIQVRLTSLDKTRAEVLKLYKNNAQFVIMNNLKNKQVAKYLTQFQTLVNIIEKYSIDNQWLYRIIGWYNLTPFYKQLIYNLLQSNKHQVLPLIQSLSVMKYDWKSAGDLIESNIFNIDNVNSFYKNLWHQIDIEDLRKLQNIIQAPISFGKRKFYQKYAPENIQSMLRSMQPSNEHSLNNVLWLLLQSIKSMCDNQIWVSKVEKYIINSSIKLNADNMQILLSCYRLMGRINKFMYNTSIKPYLMDKKMNKITDLIDSIEFLICSESQDNVLINSMFDKINKIYHPNLTITQPYKTKMHIYWHYLKIKGFNFKFNQKFQEHLNHRCSQMNQGKTSLGILVNKDKFTKLQKNTNQSSFIGKCLCQNNQLINYCNQLTGEKRGIFQKQYSQKVFQIDFKNAKIFEKSKFCGFQLQYSFYNQNRKQLQHLQIKTAEVVFNSGRMKRQIQIRDQILAHYGIKTIYFNITLFKTKGRISEGDLLMHRRIIDFKSFTL